MIVCSTCQTGPWRVPCRTSWRPVSNHRLSVPGVTPFCLYRSAQSL